MVKHHPDTALLTDYAAGSLDYGKSLCVSVHLENCSECRQRVAGLSEVGGEMLGELQPVAVEADALASVMARLDESQAQTLAQSMGPATLPSGVPRPLAKLIPDGFDALPWKRVTRSLQSVVLPAGDTSNQVSLIRMLPGGTVGEHHHAGDELTVVLRGGFSDAGGVYRAGDFVALGAEDQHQPIAHQNEDCICLAAQDGPIQFSGFWSRMLNPFIRINPQ